MAALGVGVGRYAHVTQNGVGVGAFSNLFSL